MDLKTDFKQIRICEVDNCQKPHKSRGFCNNHYRLFLRNGSPTFAPKKPLAPRFWKFVVKTDTCWLWIGAKYKSGYGEFHLNRRTQRAHRIAYELLVGPIPEGLTIDHLCRVVACVNPAHLEPVTLLENLKRTTKPFCKNGHERIPGSKNCYACVGPKAVARAKAWVENNRERSREYKKAWHLAKKARLKDEHGKD